MHILKRTSFPVDLKFVLRFCEKGCDKKVVSEIQKAL